MKSLVSYVIKGVLLGKQVLYIVGILWGEEGEGEGIFDRSNTAHVVYCEQKTGMDV